MMIDNEHEGTRDLLRKSTSVPPPAGLEDRLLLSIAAMADKRVKRRAVFSGLLQCAAIGLVLLAVAQTLLPGAKVKVLAATAARLMENPGGKVVWLLQNTYFLFPLLGFFIFVRIYKLRAG